MNRFSPILKRPIIILLAICVVISLFIFRDFGFTWDEPLDYAYGDALGYAYNPVNWFSGHFDLSKSYGPSADDHKNRGPAYLLLAREPVYLIEKFHVNTDDAWHLINFLTFLVGVYFLYKICERFMRSWAAFAASALFLLQPLLWGHAFINDKDPPFLVFLTGAVYLGFRMVDQLAESKGQPARKTFLRILLPAFFVGIATSISRAGAISRNICRYLLPDPSSHASNHPMDASLRGDFYSRYACHVALFVGKPFSIRSSFPIHVR